jgi:transposase
VARRSGSTWPDRQELRAASAAAELRELLRYRRKLVESQAAERNRLLKLLETSPEAMADLARGQLRRKRADLILALDGRLEEHHRFLLAVQLRGLEAAEQDIAALDDRIEAKLKPYCVQHALLMQISGVDWVVAAALIAEIGVDMSVFLSVFLSVYHLAAWAGVCPGNHESAGKQKSGRARKGNANLRTMLVGAAISRTSSTASRPAAAPCAQRSPSLTKSSSPPITCSPKLTLSRPRRSLSRPDQPDPNRHQPQTPPRTPRLQRHPRIKGQARMTPHPS